MKVRAGYANLHKVVNFYFQVIFELDNRVV